MRFFRIVVFLLAVLSINPNLYAALEDKLVAIVNDEIITEKDVKDFLNALYLQLSSQYEEDKLKEEMARIEEDALQRLIEDKLIVQRGEELGAQIENSAIESRYQFMKTQFPSDEEFDLYLKMKGLTPSDLKEKIAEQILMRQVVEFEVRSKVFVHPQEVTDYYNEHQKDFQDVEKVDLDSIFIRIDGSEQAAIQKAQEIQGRLANGEDFAFLAAKYSDHPSLGTVKRNQLNEQIEEIVFNLRIGEVSDLIRTNTGFYIFRLKDKTVSGIIPLEEITDDISMFLHEVKFQEKYIEWMEELKNEAYILIK